MEAELRLGILVILLASVARQLTTANQGTDCRQLSGHTTGLGSDTCTVQLTLNDTEAGIISSLKAKYQDFPLRCRFGKTHPHVSYES